MTKETPPLCDGCGHLFESLRTDFKPNRPQYFCGEPTFLELDSNKPGPWLGFVPVRHEECLAMDCKSVPSETVTTPQQQPKSKQMALFSE